MLISAAMRDDASRRVGGHVRREIVPSPSLCSISGLFSNKTQRFSVRAYKTRYHHMGDLHNRSEFTADRTHLLEYYYEKLTLPKSK